MSEQKFNPHFSLEVLQSTLTKYVDNEQIENYSEDCFIQDVLFFLGKAIDSEKYGYDARTYRRFLAQKIAPITEGTRKSVFLENLKRGGS